MKLKFICQNDNIRLGEELKLHISRKLYRNIKSTQTIIYVNGAPYETYKNIFKGDIIELEIVKENNIEWPIYDSDLDILFENENYLIVNKPSGLLSIPTKAEPRSMYQEVINHLKKNNKPLTASILNRLDKDTKGLMVIAKNRFAAYNLQPTHEKMVRKYLCLCHGILEEKEGRIENLIAKNEDSFKRYISKDTGKLAISNYKVIKEYENTSLVEFILETGRTHQIRLHCSNLGHPICGDSMYGIEDNYKQLCLCSYYVKFYDSFEEEDVEIELKEVSFNGGVQ